MYFHNLFGVLFVLCSLQQFGESEAPSEQFLLEFQWSYINFTWPSVSEYQDAIVSSRYIPENNAMAGIKYYDNKMFVALPRLHPGTPVTLALVPFNARNKTNPLLQPYPSWSMNQLENCLALQNVQSMEIDRNGVMWVLDGVRINNFTHCPPKIVLLDVKNGGKVLQTYEVPNEISLHRGGFLNDIVVDESDGGYAYITDNSPQNPGIIVYSWATNKAWKITDGSMLAEPDSVNFEVDGVVTDNPVPIDGIALSPAPAVPSGGRKIFYCALAGVSLYSVNSTDLKNEHLCETGSWKKHLVLVGKKESQSDGLVVDNEGNLYFGLLSSYGVGTWNIEKPFNTARVVETDRSKFIWPDSFAFDVNGNLYVLTNGINKFFSSKYKLRFTDDIKFRILRLHTGTQSYLYS